MIKFKIWRVTFFFKKKKGFLLLKKIWDRLPVFMQETIFHVRTEFMLFLKTYKCNGDIITDNDTMNRHKSQCILIQSILYNNVLFLPHM